jgi:hypothetical protein
MACVGEQREGARQHAADDLGDHENACQRRRKSDAAFVRDVRVPVRMSVRVVVAMIGSVGVRVWMHGSPEARAKF